jgi:hypothetical protein
VRWVPASGRRDDFFNDVLMLASQGVNRDLVRKVEPFRLDALVPYKPDYLSGFLAERHAIGIKPCFEQAVHQVRTECRRRCSRDVPGDTQRFLSVSTAITDPTFKHILLPLHVLAYRYRAKLFRVLVNGQTGEVQGEAPLSWVKVLLLVLVIGALAATVVLFVRNR